MARNKRKDGPTPVEAIQHDDKRSNIPTADAQEFVDPQLEAVRRVRYQRDESLDPQLVWRSKYEEEPKSSDGIPGVEPVKTPDLVADAPPIYIQEKIDPRVLIENLRSTATGGEPEPELTLFETFDGLSELDLVEFYQHQANWSNRMILGDSLQVMASLAERELLRGKVQMIYIDPPYGIKFGSNWQVSTRKRDVKDGKLEDAAREAEQVKAFRDTWALGIHSYLSYLRDRLLVARDLLTESGSCFVQIGDENVHLVRSLMDEVFGSENFVSAIVVRTTMGATAQLIPNTADYVLWYAKSFPSVKYRALYSAKLYEAGAGLYRLVKSADGSERRATEAELKGETALRPGERLFRPTALTSQRPPGDFPVELGGVFYRPGKGYWKTSVEGMRRLTAARRLRPTQGSSSIQYVRFLDDFPAMPLNNVWTDTGTGSFTDEKVYVVQTNVKVVQRCLLMATDPGDLVLDPTCGSGTTAYVAEQWGRRWITIDTSRVALALARQRLMGARFPYYLLADSEEGRVKEAQITGKSLPPATPTNDVRHGFVYERVQHITLKSIANNPDIHEGMSREEINAVIKRHADFELLYDKPYEDKRRVRVTGPLTVESLSPHRSLAFARSTSDEHRESISEQLPDAESDGANFEQTILANLRKAGIQNGRRNERILFETLEPYAATYVQAVGERRTDGADSAPSRVGIAIGPQYGTVSPSFIKAAAREAIRAEDVDLLCVLGFAFDPQASGVTEADGITVEAGDGGFASVTGSRRLGRIPVLLVRMNADLLMGEELAKTGAGNLFTVFGEPDIEILTTDDGRLVVDLCGVDVYDPTTGEVRSNDTSKIALWMLDTNYNDESFFVRHCYFTGGNDPYKRLKTALKADIDADAWESLHRTTSRPFDQPDTGKIAVKVINDYGDEVMKVFKV